VTESPCDQIERWATALDAWGCTADEIDRIEADQGPALPDTYRCFLRAAGRDGGGCFEGGFATYPYVLGARETAILLLEANQEDSPDEAVFRLPDDALVISLHDEGYAFMFVRTSLGESAPVEMWSEGLPSDRTQQMSSSLFEWVRVSMIGTETSARHEACRRDLQRLLRRGFEPPCCPSCAADWSGYQEVREVAAPRRWHEGTLITCQACGDPARWWWGNPPRPLRKEGVSITDADATR
jgi:hypothetical protein